MPLAEHIVTCLSHIEIEQLVAGMSVQPELLAHLAICTACQGQTEAARRNNQLMAELRDMQSSAAIEEGAATEVNSVPGYELQRKIYSGAQGVVFEAVQLGTKRRAAVKIIRHGRFATSRQRMRFEREIEIVAALRHPNIAMLYESGVTTEGSAYFAMEYVNGVALDQFREWKTVSLREVSALFVKICLAVAYAHQRGVIHYDLKPGNILIDHDGEPRVLDFGLALAADTHARREQNAGLIFAGTFAYASPEQLAGESQHIDFRSDVYSLGLIFYELLTGVKPHAQCQTLAELIAARQDNSRISLQKIRRDMPRDLEMVIGKALHADPAHRYRSASELCEDIERYLDGRPILSLQDNLGYVLVKLIRRRKKLVQASAFAALLILAVLAFALRLFVQHEHEQDKSMDTLAAFQQVLEAADPLSGLSTNTPLNDFLEHVGRNVQQHLSDQPETAASIHITLGQVALNMADYNDAHAHFSKALSLREEVLDDGHPAIAESLHNLARAVFFLGRYAEAASIYREALAARVHALGDSHPDVANTMSHLASCLRRLGEAAEAEQLLRDALAIRESANEVPAADIAASLNNLGSFLLEKNELDQALIHFDRALTIIENSAGSEDWRVAHTLYNRATCLNSLGRHAKAEADLVRAQRIWQAVVAPDHPSLVRVQVERARTLLHLEQITDAETLVRSAIKNTRGRLGDKHPDLAASLELLGGILMHQGQHAQAASAIAEALNIRRVTTPSNAALLVDPMNSLGESHIKLERFEDAEQLLLEALALADANANAGVHPKQLARTLLALVDLYQAWGRPDDAKQYQSQLATASADVVDIQFTPLQ